MWHGHDHCCRSRVRHHPQVATRLRDRINWPWVPAAFFSVVATYVRYGKVATGAALLLSAALVGYVLMRARRQRRLRAELLPRLVGLDEAAALAEVRKSGLVASIFGVDDRHQRRVRRRRHDSERVTLV